MALDKNISLGIGVLMVIFVGINVALIFTDNFGRASPDILTGATTVSNICFETVGGVECESNLYIIEPENGCSVDSSSACTNACQINRALADDDRACPSYCKNYCVSQELLMKLQ